MKLKYIALIFVCLAVLVGTFELHPAIKLDRIIVPEEIYVGQSCDCRCILQSRPWYSRINHWFWLWVIATPLFVFSVKPTAPKWQQALRTLIGIGFCYFVMNFAIHLSWDIRNGPFIVHPDPDFPWQKSWDIPNCTNIADGASIAFTSIFGWIYASIYYGIWYLVWLGLHMRKARHKLMHSKKGHPASTEKL